MVVYTVYEPPHPARDPVDRALQLVFIKDGFLWMAALVPVVWLLFKGLWLELIAFLLAAAALTWGVEALGAPPSVGGTLFLILQIAFGFEASWIYSLALERRGWRMVGPVTGRDEADCERRFLETWLPTQSAASHTTGDMPPAGPPLASWTATMRKNARESLARGRRLIGAKA